MKKVIYIGASWCPQCKVLRPQVEAYCKGKEVPFIYVDADEQENIVQMYGVRNLPTIIVLVDDEIVARGTGIADWSKVKESV